MVIVYYANAHLTHHIKWFVDIPVKRFLLSYVLTTKPVLNYYYKNLQYELFLDSGAFSAFGRGLKIDLYKYIKFCLAHRKRFTVIAALDVIGSPEASFENYKIMVKEGLDNCLPAWHFPEPWSILEQYCKMTDYVGIGGLVRSTYGNMSSQAALRATIIKKAMEIAKKQNVKLHLYGMTSLNLLKAFKEVHSVDSTSWMSGGAFARVMPVSGQPFSYKGRGSRFYLLDKYNIMRALELEQMLNEQQHSAA